MPPRRQPVRQVQSANAQRYDPDVVAKRTKRHLDELERSNYSESSTAIGYGADDEEDAAGGRTTKGRARQTISDKRMASLGIKKKSTMNIRTAVLYKKSFAMLLEESGIASYSPNVPTYLTAAAPAPKVPPRMFCTVCGYWGKYRCKRCGMAYCDKNCEDVHDETRRECAFACGIGPFEVRRAGENKCGKYESSSDIDTPPTHSQPAHLPLSSTPTTKKMCPHANGDSAANDRSEMVPIDLTNGGTRTHTNGHDMKARLEQQRRNPYAPRASDFLSNVSNFKIIESTLRGARRTHHDEEVRADLQFSTAEGEQFANAFFDTKTKIAIAKALDAFGVEYIELTSPVASEQSRRDCEAICKLGLKAKILTHIRCHMDDARIAVETGVDGVDVVIGTSSFLREFSHGKDMAYITKTAIEVINFVKSKGSYRYFVLQ
ncbi:hypothetical protein NM688_g9379 [Phlebia brevispora]|uniref:Uncharacterized protein n=1 Tax=Phlebia brevispora TaxID=194682 RepID=A0ACC1RIY2_9APHY|nr:hypothetical protein NM688_g9379 [Phlebia brevispora]